MKHYRAFVMDAINELVRRSSKAPAVVLQQIAEELRDKPEYVGKLAAGKSFLPMKKIKKLVGIRARVLKRMTKEYRVEEGDLADVPAGGCTLHHYLYERGKPRVEAEEEDKTPKSRLRGKVPAGDTEEDPVQLDLPFDAGSPKNVAKSLFDNSLRIVVHRDPSGAIRAVMLAAAVDVMTYDFGSGVQVVASEADVAKLAAEDVTFAETIRLFSNFRA